MTTFDIIILFICFGILSLGFGISLYNYVKCHNELIDTYTEIQYWKSLFEEMKKEKNALEKINK